MKTVLTLGFVIIALVAGAQVKFDQPVLPPAWRSSTSMVTGDFDGNGRGDVILAVDPFSTLKAFYSNAEHNYTEKTLDITNGKGTFLGLLLAGDLNKDGKDDIVVRDRSNGNILACLSNGQDFDVKSLPLNPYASQWDATIIDFNHDGNLDIVAVASGVPVQVYAGDGAGNFQVTSFASLIPAFPGNSFQFFIGDLNNDHELDFVISTTLVFKTYIRQPDGSYNITSISQSGYIPDYVLQKNTLLADFTGDGIPDLVIATRFDRAGTTPLDVLNLYRNNGDGTFAAPEELHSLDNGLLCVNHADFDHDGQEDLVAGGQAPNSQFFVFHNTGGGTFEKQIPYKPLVHVAEHVAFMDLDGTGNLEVVVATYNLTLEWNKLQSNAWTLTDTNIFGVMATGGGVYDIDHDGIKDIFSMSSVLPGAAIWYGKGGLQYEEPVNILFDQAQSLSAMDIGDLNKDGYGDIVYSIWTYPSGGSMNVLLSTGPRTFGPPIKLSNEQSYVANLADVDNDSDLDIIAQQSVIKNNGGGQFSSPVSYPLPFYTPGDFATGYFNNDNFIDFAITGNGGLYLYLNNGSGGFPSYKQVELTKAVGYIHTGDVNNDGRSEILASGTTYYSDHYDTNFALLTNQGNATFTQSFLPTDGISWVSPLSLGDLDGDGLKDIVTPFPQGSLGVFAGRPDGTFDPVVKVVPIIINGTVLGMQGYDLSLSDLDGDSMLDVVQFMGSFIPLMIFPNATNRQPLTNPTSIVAAAKDVEATISSNKGNGTGRIFFVRKASDDPVLPVNGTTYAASATFGSSSIAGNSVVLASDGQSVVVNGLMPGTSYIATAFEYRYVSGTYVYTDTGISTSFTTLKSQKINFSVASGQVMATASSGLTTVLSLVSGNGSVVGNSYSITADPGTVKLHATQNGNSVYMMTTADTVFCVFPPKPTLTATSTIGQLKSSSLDNNTWYLNDQLVPSVTSQIYDADANGVYKVKVTIDGCGVFSDPLTVKGVRKQQTINITNIDHLVVGTGTIATVTASSGLPVMVTITPHSDFLGDGTIMNNQFFPDAAGQIQLHVSQAGTDDYKPASIDATFCIYPPKPILSMSTSGVQVNLSSSSDANNIWLMNNVQQDGSGKTFIPTMPGTYKVMTTVNGCVSDASEPVNIAANKTQVISFINTVDNYFGSGNNTVKATASSGLPVQLTLRSGNGTITDSGFAPNAPGKVTLNALQSGNISYLPVQADLSFCVNPPKPAITESNDKVPTLTSSSDNNNQWYNSSDPIFGATGKTFTATTSGYYKVVVSIDGCSSASNVIEVEKIVTGVEEVTATSFSLTPNPATSVVRIALPKGFVGEPVFVSTIGKQVYPPVTKYENELSVDIAGLSPGLYIVRLSDVSLKMIKQ